IQGIYKTIPILVVNDFIGPAAFFDTVIQLENGVTFQLSRYDILPWTSNEPLQPASYFVPANEPEIEVIGQKIVRVLRRNPNEFPAGFLSLLLGNDIFIAHEGFHGDQLFIGDFNTDYQ